jgi:DNA repair exonuclease SbcCD nuclease subunit
MEPQTVLVVGDMHVVPEELRDCTAVIQLILESCRAHNIREVWFTGDQHHTHSVVRLEVMNWWMSAFKALTQDGLKVLCLVGNHDQASPGSELHAMTAYKHLKGVEVIDKPAMRHGVLLLPYYHTQEEFTKACLSYAPVKDKFDGFLSGAATVFCHQTFNGSRYENGIYAHDGFDPNLIPQESIISGHIHAGQEFGKVWYVGAPRWRSLNDANTERAIWALKFQKGRLVERQSFSTGEVCRQIKHVDDTPENPVKLPLDPRHQWRVDVRGPLDYCQARKKELHAAGARVRPFPTQVSTIGRIRESEGVEKAFRTFLEAYQCKHGTDRSILSSMVKERLSV